MNESRLLLTVDELGDGIARVETAEGRTWEVPSTWLPEGVREGDCLILAVDAEQEKSILTLVVDRDATDAARKRISSKLDRLRSGER